MCRRNYCTTKSCIFGIFVYQLTLKTAVCMDFFCQKYNCSAIYPLHLGQQFNAKRVVWKYMENHYTTKSFIFGSQYICNKVLHCTVHSRYARFSKQCNAESDENSIESRLSLTHIDLSLKPAQNCGHKCYLLIYRVIDRVMDYLSIQLGPRKSFNSRLVDVFLFLSLFQGW